jgi:hypothetical protein
MRRNQALAGGFRAFFRCALTQLAEHCSGLKQDARPNPMKESTLSKITASVAAAKGMAQKALAASPNPQWTEYEMQSVDAWIALQGGKMDRSEAIRRLVALGLARGK